MATLSLPTNTPATDGAVIGCTTDDTNGTAYGMVRDDRQWYFEVSANPLVTQAMIDADKATIIAQDITASELVWAGTDTDLATVQATVDGLAESDGPFYVGWVQFVDAVDTGVFQFLTGTAGFAFSRGGDQTAAISSGVLITRGADLELHPYADWDGDSYSNGSGLSQGILLENGSTRQNWPARNFDHANWANTGNVTFGSLVEAPDGTLSATPLTFPAEGAALVNSTASAGNSASVWLKGTGQISIECGSTSVSITLSAEWERHTVAEASATSIGIARRAGDSATATVWHAQLETDEQGTTEIMGTEDATATRPDCVLSQTFANLNLPAGITDDFCYQVQVVLPRDVVPSSSYYLLRLAAADSSDCRVDVYVTTAKKITLRHVVSGVSEFITATSSAQPLLSGDVLDLRVKQDATGVTTFFGAEETISAGAHTLSGALTDASVNAGPTILNHHLLKFRFVPSALTDQEIRDWV